jgi:hypothetical protein
LRPQSAQHAHVTQLKRSDHVGKSVAIATPQRK